MTLWSYLRAAVLSGMASGAYAEHMSWSYGDWQVYIEHIDTGEDLRVTCTAWTGGDGLPSLYVAVSNGDAGPPNHYPSLTIRETAPRHHLTQMLDGQAVAMSIDGKVIYYALVDARLDDNAIFVAEAPLRWKDAGEALWWARAGDIVDITLVSPNSAGTALYRASLSGFTAAYGKMMDSCGHGIELPAPAN